MKLKSVIFYPKTAVGDTRNNGGYEYCEPYVISNSIFVFFFNFLFFKQRAQTMRYSDTVNMAAAAFTKLNGPKMLDPVRVGCSVL